MSLETNTPIITLDVLTVASRDVLGASRKLTVASPCQFTNASGNLRPIENYDSVGKIAYASGVKFKESLSKNIR